MMRASWLFLALVVLPACRKESSLRRAPSASASAPAAPSWAVLREAELSRNAALVAEDFSSSRDEATRAAAARALARIADARARDALLPALSDESAEVVRWAVFGLGKACAGQEREITAALALRSAALLSDVVPSAAEPLPALADALARCASSEAERTLRAWLNLDRPIAESAALALGKLAARRGTLEESTLIALLDAAARREQPLDGALYAFTRLSAPEGTLHERALDLALTAALRDGVPGSFGVRALGRLGATAAAPLATALAQQSKSNAERTEIARELGRLGEAGQHELGEALAARVSEPVELDLEASPGESDVLLALLDGLQSVTPVARNGLESLARLPIPTAARAARRAVELRCAAARLLAGRSTENAELQACDPNPGAPAGKHALLSVLDRGKLVGKRARRFGELLVDPDARVRQASLRILPGHREYTETAAAFGRALSDAAPGVVATAAELLAKHPAAASLHSERREGTEGGSASEVPSAVRPSPAVVAALSEALRRAEKGWHVEVHAALLDATAALGVLSLNAELERACRSHNSTLRERAERARRALNRNATACTPSGDAIPVPELGRLLGRPTRLEFETEAGPLSLELDPALAPIATTRLGDLVKTGFFDGMAVHRVVPGFVVQLGDPGGDGYGGADLPPLRCELSPRPFEPGSVGIALSGRDTGNSQFFVTLGRFPHLDGEYTLIGRAGPGWERLRTGDRVLRARWR